MSYLMSTRLSRAQYVVAIVGATGSLGKEVVNVFLTAYRPFFPRVLALLRETSSPAAQALAAQGAELHKIDASNPGPSLVKALEGVDVLVSLVGRAPLEYKNAVFEAALKNGVKVYFPSEFGSDYRLNDFPGWDNFDWNIKREHVAKAREIAQGKVKIVATYTGLFLEIAIAVSPFGIEAATFVSFRADFSLISDSTPQTTRIRPWVRPSNGSQ
ncbi:hypothetical protein AcW1_008430 [Taiwanofungus camphoratus]|nr:hypothetical protein AcV5_008722 [Antrodia cinnamomea]KAI0951376.1 hypothetical protein AcW1_008430 [Antrodia cinnamomea]KAI0956281.1 hypothetical protein AcV7_006719 [Antrodia cinnamomea]